MTQGWSEAWRFIDGEKINVPLDYYDAIKFGWHKGADFRRWFPCVDVVVEIEREVNIRNWCANTFNRDTYTTFHDSIWFYREKDAIICQLKWS